MDNRLQKIIDSGHIPHAMVIEGRTYEERLSAANIVASALICESIATRPCGQCVACKKVSSYCHPDVTIVLPEENKKTLSVEIIRNMRDDTYLMPNESTKKVYIIAKGEMMQDYAQNALLKVLEEPPGNVAFIILCPSHTILLPTVLSRVAVFSIDNSSNIASIPEQDNGALDFAVKLCKAVISKNEFSMLITTCELEKNYDILSTALEHFDLIIRDALVINSGFTSLIGPDETQSNALASTYSKEQLFRIREAVADIANSIAVYSNKNLTTTRLTSLLATAICS